MPTDRTVLVRLKANPSDFVRGMTAAKAAVGDLRREIDTTNDRTAWLAQGFLALGPTLGPLGASAVPVLSGMATQLTLTAVAAGVTAVAFNGVGDALDSLDKYQLDPTVANLEKMNEAMRAIGPAGEQFVRMLDSLEPALKEIENTAREGLFPGVTEGIQHLVTLLPQVQRIVGETAKTLGDLADAGGAGLAGPRFAEFFTFLETDAQPILAEMGRTIGNFVDGFAAMIVGFLPLTEDFSTGLENMSKSFADWAHGLSTSSSFANFVSYVREVSPKVLDLLESFAEMFVQIVQASAPVGAVMLPLLTQLFELVAAIADTPIASVFIAAGAAMAAYGRAAALASITTGGLVGKMAKSQGGVIAQTRAMASAIPTMGQFGTAMYRAGQSAQYQSEKTKAANAAVGKFTRGMAPAATATGLLVAQTTGLSDSLGLSNATSLALAGTLIGPWGTAIGGAAGLMLDLKNAAKETADAIQQASDAAYEGTAAQQQAALANVAAQASYLATSNSFKANAARIIGVLSGQDLALEASAIRLNNSIRLSQASAGEIGSLLTQNLSPALRETADVLGLAAQESERFTESLAAMEGNLSKTDALLAYKQAILDVKDAIANNGPNVNQNTKAGIANLRTLQGMAHDLLRVLETMDEGPGRDTFLRGAIQQLKNLANQMDPTGRTAKRLLEDLGLLDKAKPKPKVDLDTKPMKGKKREVQTFLDWLDRQTATPSVDLNLERAKQKLRDLGAMLTVSILSGGPWAPAIKKAEGGHILGAGTATSDSIPAYLSNGEYVVKAAAVQRYGVAMFDQLNAMRYASGGYVAAQGAGMDYAQLAAAVSGDRLMGYRDTHGALLAALRTALGEVPVMRAPRDVSMMVGAI